MSERSVSPKAERQSKTRWLLRLYPRRFRNARGEEVLRSLAEDLRDARRQGGVRGALGAVWAILDVVVAAIAERIRALPSISLSALWADLRFAARALRRAPGFTLLAAATLALPIGAATTIFSVVNGVLLKPLPYRASDRLVNIWNDLGQGAQSLPAVHPLDFRDYQAWTQQFEELAAATGGNMVQATGVLSGDDAEPEQVDVSAVTANLFPLLGVEPWLGRQLTRADEQLHGPPVALLTHGLWSRRYGADPGLVGRTIIMDGRHYLVAGVLPPGFHLHLPAEAFLVKDAQVWVPLRLDETKLPPRNFTPLTVFGRLKPGVGLAQAQGEMDAIAERLRREHPVHRASNLRIRVVELHHDVVKGVGPLLITLLAAVGVVLLIGCANVAGLLLARGTQRRRELVVHAALGASRGRLAGRLLVESLMLAVLGTAGGLGVTLLALHGLSALLPSVLPRVDDIGLDASVLGMASLVTVGTALLVGILPAWQSPAIDLGAELRSGSRSSPPQRDRLRRLLVVAEVALAIVLLTSTGLLVRSLLALQRARPGFDAEPVLTFRLSLPAARYADAATRLLFERTVERKLRDLPGVVAVGATSQLPLTGSGSLQPYAYDAESSRNWESVTADGRNASPDFFRAMGARLVAGRFFVDADSGPAPVIIIDTDLARRAFPGGDAVGRRLQVAPAGDPDAYAEVVGVVEHLHLHDLARPLLPQIWQPVQGDGRQIAFALRAEQDPASLAGAVRETVRSLDANLAISDLVPMSRYVEAASGQARLSVVMMLVFGALALLLAGIGVYAVVAYAVAQRTREYGIRMALGQDPARLRRMVLLQGLKLGVPAVLLGAGAALLAARLLDRMLYEVTPADPLTFGATALLVLGVMVLASWVPAWRASRVDPRVALGAE